MERAEDAGGNLSPYSKKTAAIIPSCFFHAFVIYSFSLKNHFQKQVILWLTILIFLI